MRDRAGVTCGIKLGSFDKLAQDHGLSFHRSAEERRLPSRSTVKLADDEINIGVGLTDALFSSFFERKAF